MNILCKFDWWRWWWNGSQQQLIDNTTAAVHVNWGSSKMTSIDADRPSGGGGRQSFKFSYFRSIFIDSNLSSARATLDGLNDLNKNPHTHTIAVARDLGLPSIHSSIIGLVVKQQQRRKTAAATSTHPSSHSPKQTKCEQPWSHWI